LYITPAFSNQDAFGFPKDSLTTYGSSSSWNRRYDTGRSRISIWTGDWSGCTGNVRAKIPVVSTRS
jgi:hypothetical protein